MRARRPKSEKVMRAGDAMMKAGHPDSKAISERTAALKDKWSRLEQYANERRRQLEDAAEACLVRLKCCTGLDIDNRPIMILVNWKVLITSYDVLDFHIFVKLFISFL